MEAERILNNRPITNVSSDAGDIEALTPNHFLLLRANPSNEEADVSEREINSTKYSDSLKSDGQEISTIEKSISFIFCP